MFDPLLSCVAFGLYETPPDWYVSLARKWSGQPNLSPVSDGLIQWHSKTRININVDGCQWYEAPPSTDFKYQSALIRVGQIEGATALVFITPVDVVATAFRAAVSQYLRKEQMKATAVRFTLDLNKAIGDFANLPPLRGIEGTTSDNQHIVVSGAFKAPPKIGNVESLELTIERQTAKVDTRYNIAVTDVSESTAEVSKCMVTLFNALSKYTKTERLPL